MFKLLGFDEEGNFITRPLTADEMQNLVEAVIATSPAI